MDRGSGTRPVEEPTKIHYRFVQQLKIFCLLFVTKIAYIVVRSMKSHRIRQHRISFFLIPHLVCHGLLEARSCKSVSKLHRNKDSFRCHYS